MEVYEVACEGKLEASLQEYLEAVLISDVTSAVGFLHPLPHFLQGDDHAEVASLLYPLVACLGIAYDLHLYYQVWLVACALGVASFLWEVYQPTPRKKTPTNDVLRFVHGEACALVVASHDPCEVDPLDFPVYALVVAFLPYEVHCALLVDPLPW
ncbi:hypothetical protein RchiOBHm_Chr4g0392691 [Rosa chinensis]|uniref:Uncharacterized protein n=1 Tax=Rosa chinensis TaxID=74649 RepID=A0A2P6QQT5_ROSCH|nr:hypothetical protein RchiOBHm_Chr4g0392691 [Rosa chinensis]